MRYYQVPMELDGAPITHIKNQIVYTHYLVATELYTDKECVKYGIPKYKLCEVDISIRNIYWFFGARFPK